MAPNWSSTMVRVDSDPVIKTTAATERPMAASYDTICADARTEPNSGYFEPDAQPANMTPYTATDDMASRNRIPIGGSASWRYVVRWKRVNVPPTGTMAKAKNAGTIDR